MPPDSSTQDRAQADSALLEHLLQGCHTLASLEVEVTGALHRSNAAFAGRAGRSMAELRACVLSDILTEGDAERVARWAGGEPHPADFTLLNFMGAGHSPFTLRCLVRRRGDRLLLVGEPETGDDQRAADELLRLNNAFATQSRELLRQTRSLTKRTDELGEMP